MSVPETCRQCQYFYLQPNPSAFDCLNTANNYGLKAARSMHTNGVNLMLCDGLNHKSLESCNTRKGRIFRGIHSPHFLNGVQER
jgi:hypothetical protein